MSSSTSARAGVGRRRLGADRGGDAELEAPGQGVPVDGRDRLPLDQVGAGSGAVDIDLDVPFTGRPAGEGLPKRVGHGDRGQLFDQRLGEPQPHHPGGGGEVGAGLGLRGDQRGVGRCWQR
ncbi:MAG TPA: hypothetical protein VGA36_07290 [Nitriliruptorales bacterium]